MQWSLSGAAVRLGCVVLAPALEPTYLTQVPLIKSGSGVSAPLRGQKPPDL